VKQRRDRGEAARYSFSSHSNLTCS